MKKRLVISIYVNDIFICSYNGLTKFDVSAGFICFYNDTEFIGYTRTRDFNHNLRFKNTSNETKYYNLYIKN